MVRTIVESGYIQPYKQKIARASNMMLAGYFYSFSFGYDTAILGKAQGLFYSIITMFVSAINIFFTLTFST